MDSGVTTRVILSNEQRVFVREQLLRPRLETKFKPRSSRVAKAYVRQTPDKRKHRTDFQFTTSSINGLRDKARQIIRNQLKETWKTDVSEAAIDDVLVKYRKELEELIPELEKKLGLKSIVPNDERIFCFDECRFGSSEINKIKINRSNKQASLITFPNKDFIQNILEPVYTEKQRLATKAIASPTVLKVIMAALGFRVATEDEQLIKWKTDLENGWPGEEEGGFVRGPANEIYLGAAKEAKFWGKVCKKHLREFPSHDFLAKFFGLPTDVNFRLTCIDELRQVFEKVGLKLASFEQELDMLTTRTVKTLEEVATKARQSLLEHWDKFSKAVNIEGSPNSQIAFSNTRIRPQKDKIRNWRKVRLAPGDTVLSRFPSLDLIRTVLNNPKLGEIPSKNDFRKILEFLGFSFK